MAAVVQIDRWTGDDGGGDPADKIEIVEAGVLWLVDSDAANSDDMVDKPLDPPGDGETTYSYWGTLRFNVTTGPGLAKTVDNLRVWFVGTAKLSAKVDLMVGRAAWDDGSNDGYRPAGSAIELKEANYTSLREAPVNADTAEGEGNAISMEGSHSGAGASDTAFDGLVLQVKVTGTGFSDADLAAMAEITPHLVADKPPV